MAIKIKICGVRSLELAQAALEAGADLIGLVCHPASKRFVEMALAKDIAAAILAHGGVPVAVFVDQNAAEMHGFCEMTGIQTVQLHGATARREHAYLPTEYHRIYVCGVGDEGMEHDDLVGIADCDPRRDCVLFDHKIAGSGQRFSGAALHYEGALPLGIAGGLHVANVRDVVETFRPVLVDVSSGVETVVGVKDSIKMKAFVEAVRWVEKTRSRGQAAGFRGE